MPEIPLTQSKTAIVDDEDYEWLNAWKWCAVGSNGYMYATRRCGRGKGSHAKMHRLIMGNPEGFFVDHVNQDTLDNRRSNLRICSASQNQHNRKIPSCNTSGVKGVNLCGGKWQVRIAINNVRKYLGVFNNLEDAAKARISASEIYHKEFARVRSLSQI